MKLNLINTNTTNDNKLIELELDLLNTNYTFNLSSSYESVKDIFKSGINNIASVNNVVKMMGSVQNIKKSLYGVFDNLSKINYGNCGLMTSKYYKDSQISNLSYDFIIENKSINLSGKNKIEAEQEFEHKFSTLLYFSLYKKEKNITNKSVIENIIKNYYDNNINKLLQGIDISTFVYKYIQTEFGKTGLIGNSDSQANLLNNLKNKIKSTDINTDIISKHLDLIENTIKNNKTNDLEYFTPEQIFLQLYERIDNKKYYFINSLTPDLYNYITQNKSTDNISFLTKLKDRGAFVFNITKLNLNFDGNMLFVEHTNGNKYPQLIKGQLVLENSRGLTLNESERLFTNYFNVNKIT